MTTTQWKAEGFVTVTMADPMRIVAIKRQGLFRRLKVKLVIPGVTEEAGQWFDAGDTITLVFPGYIGGGK